MSNIPDSDVIELYKLVVALTNLTRDSLSRIVSLEVQAQMATQNEQKILAFAATLASLATAMSGSISRLEAKLQNVESEDLSDELAALGESAEGLQEVADKLNALAPEVAEAELPTAGSEEGSSSGEAPATGGAVSGDAPIVTPIEHGDVEVTPLAGSSGGTDGVQTGDPQAPGTSTGPTEGGSSEPATSGEPVTGSTDEEATESPVGADEEEDDE